MDLHVLKTFVAVCEYSGFSAAAEKLGYTQSTVSSQIRQLEKELNVILFDRFYHKISLTEDGRTVLKYAREMLTSQEKMMTDLHHQEEISGELRLAMSSSLCTRYFGNDFVEFRKKYPHIRLKIIEAGTAQLFSMLRKNEVDLVFTLDTHIYDSEFTICAECEEKVHFVVSSGHRLAAEKELNLADIISEPFIMTEKDMSYRRILDEQLAARSLEIVPVLEIGNPAQICSVAANSDMIAFLPDFMTAAYMQEKKLVYLPVTDCKVSVWTQLLIHKNKWRSPALNVLLMYYRKLIEKKEKTCQQCSNHCPVTNLKCAVGKRAWRIEQERKKQRM